MVVPRNRTISAGVTLTLPCVVSGYPTPKVDWTKSDGKISASRASMIGDSLEISGVIRSDSGKYICSASNAAGMVEAEIHVIVLAHPNFVEKPSDEVMQTGGSKKLSCSMEGEPYPLVMWRLPGDNPDNLIFLQKHDAKYQMEDDGSLVINNFDYDDTGVYTCMGMNEGGGIMAKSRVLAVKAFPPPVIGIRPHDQKFRRGDTLKLPCVPASGVSETTVTWWHQASVHLPKKEIHEDRNAGIILSGSLALVIRNANKSQSGIYTCRVESETGSVEATALVKFDFDRTLPSLDNDYMPSSPTKPKVRVLNSTSVRLSWQPNSNAVKKFHPRYMVEYWRDGWNEWRIAKMGIFSDHTVISRMEPDFTYTFLVRSIVVDKQSFPSPWSDPIRMREVFNKRLPSRTQWLSAKKLEKPTLYLVSAVVTSPTTTQLKWESLSDKIHEDGVLIYTLLNEKNVDRKSSEHKVHVASVLGSSTSTYSAQGLLPNKEYTFFIVPMWGDIEGTPSNSITVRTRGECELLMSSF